MPKELSQTLQSTESNGAIQGVTPHKEGLSSEILTSKIKLSPLPLKKASIKKSGIPKNSFVLSYSDSVKLNLIRVRPTSNDFFDNNVLTRTLTPLSSMADKELVVRVDSLNKDIAKSDLGFIATPVAIPVDTAKVAGDSTYMVASDTVKKAVSKPKITSVHVVKEQAIKATSPFQDSKIFLLVIVLFSVALLGYVRLKSSRFLKTIFKGLWSHHEARRLFSTVNVRNSLHSVMLDVLFVFNVGVLVYEVVSLFTNNNSLLMSFFIFMGSLVGVTIYFLIKILLFRSIGFIFSTKEKTTEYLFFVGVVNKTYGIFLTPILVILPFTTSTSTYVTLGIAVSMYALLYIIQLLRGFKIILGKVITLFYFILYLCTLEILPVIIAYRLLSK